MVLPSSQARWVASRPLSRLTPHGSDTLAGSRRASQGRKHDVEAVDGQVLPHMQLQAANIARYMLRESAHMLGSNQEPNEPKPGKRSSKAPRVLV